MKRVIEKARIQAAQLLKSGVVLLAALGPAAGYAVTPSSLSQAPLFLVTSATPLVMINMSNDHQLFYKAYDDWSDVDGDGTVDTSYDHGIDYYGYFDSSKCYNYDSGAGRFEPVGISASKYCDSVAGADWSGNFLNWASMSRIDVVRKILFGGYRSTDTTSTTVLERAYLPGDAHSFAKHFSTTTTEMRKLTPWSVTDITLCNTTYASNGDSDAAGRTEPPLIRVADGNFALWAANERYQCHWADKSELESNIFNSPNPNTNNGNYTPITGLAADADNPSWLSDRLGNGDYIVRVEACKSTALKGNEKCKVYPDNNLKPIGLLQEYGDEESIEFGLMTGSYGRNKSGGTLRKNVESIADEINVDTDGTFKSAPTDGNIISYLSALRVSGYDHNPGYYNNSDNCSWGLSSFSDGNCTNWGNPQSEIFLETLRYFAGASANSSFASSDSGYIQNSVIASSWDDPLSSDNYCAPVNVIQFNASVTSYDADQLGGVSSLASFGSMSSWTDSVGDHEGISGNEFFVGEGTGSTTTDGICTAKTVTGLSDAQGLCPEAPRLQGSFNIAGLAFYANTNSIRTDVTDEDGDTVDINVRTYGVTLSPAVPKIEVPVPGSDKVLTILPACRNESIGGNCAIVDFKVVQKHTEASGIATAKFYVNWEDSEQGGDYDQDMAGVLSYEVNSTHIRVTTGVFADSTPNKLAFGYIISGTEQDGFHAHSGINYFTAYTDPTGVLTCSNGSINCETGQPQTSVVYAIGESVASLLDDPLLLAAKYGGFDEEELTQSEGGGRPDDADAPNDVPDQDYEWDADGDGLPDTYFFSTNPSELETSLSAVFLDVSKQLSSSSSTAANSQRVSTDTTIYQARFASSDWHGELLAFAVNEVTGALSADPTWDAGERLESVAQSSRVIITHKPGTGGVPFDWSSLSTTQQNHLHLNPTTLSGDTLGDERLDYLRGDRSLEVQNGGTFRDRSRKLGDLINSSPAFVGPPGFGYPDWLEVYEIGGSSRETYSEYKARMFALNSGAGRTEMLYVGGNDGMLHGFTASSSAIDGGYERLAYVPNAVFPTLSQLTSPDYEHRYYVDGSPTVGDVMFDDDDWHTMLVGGLNAGGQGIYALDVTYPSGFSESNAGNILLWEISNLDAGFSELGYTFSRPALVKNHSGSNAYTRESGEGEWIAVFGNGYASASGHAILYIVDAESGTLVDTVVADTSGDNGLSTVSPVDVDGDYKVDVIYAGDLKGNIWKFIPDGTLKGWKVDFGACDGGVTVDCNPLFATPATNSISNDQPVTARIEVGRHPWGLPGVMVYFGTGSYFQVGDNVGTSDRDSIYGIWDLWNSCNNSDGTRKSACGSTYTVYDGTLRTPPSTPAISRSNLLMQCVTGADASTCKTPATTPGGDVVTGTVSGGDIRLISKNLIDSWDWRSNKGYMGWYLDLPDYGEKQVSRQILRAGRLIFVSIVPSEHACKDGGESWLWELDPATGGRLDLTVFDLNGDGVFDVNDNFVSANSPSASGTPPSVTKPPGIIQPPSIVTGPEGKREFKYSSSSTGDINVTTENPGILARGRKSWMRVR